MPKIPIYDQQQLASSAVGTPGRDDSNAQLFNAVGREADSVAAGVNRFMLAERYELRRAQREQQAYEKAQQAELDKLEVSSHAAKLDLLNDQRREALKEKRINNPKGAAQEYLDGVEAVNEQYIQDAGIVDPIMQSKVRTVGLKSARESAGRLTTWESTQRTANAQSTFDTTLAEFALSMGQSGESVDDFLANVEKLNKYIGEQEELLGPSVREKQITAVKEGAKNWLSKLARTKPEAAEKIISEGVLGALIGEKEVGPIYNAAQLDIKREQKKQEDEKKSADSQMYIDMTSDLKESLARQELTDIEVDNFEQVVEQSDADPKLKESVKRTIRSIRVQKARQDKTLETKEEKEALKKEQGALRTKIGEYNAKFGSKAYREATIQNLSKGEAMAQLLDYHGTLIQAHSAGAINDNAYGSQKAKVEILIRDLEKSQTGTGWASLLPKWDILGNGRKQVKDNSPNAETYLKVYPLAEAKYLQYINAYESKNDSPPSAEQLRRLWQAALQKSIQETQ